MTKTQQHALAVIRARGAAVAIVDGQARCGWHRCSFAPRTVRELAALGLLTRAPGGGEAYTLKVDAEAALPADAASCSPPARGRRPRDRAPA